MSKGSCVRSARRLILGVLGVLCVALTTIALPSLAVAEPGGDGAVAVEQEQRGDGNLFRWSNGQWMRVDGWGIRVAVAPDGSPWVVNSNNEIWRFANGIFDKLPGLARDIGIGGDGTAWIIGTDDAVYRWNGRDWDRMQEASGVSISVDRSGAPWVVNGANEIHQWEGSRFIIRSGRARDVGAGSAIWIIGTDNQVYRRGPNEWMPMGGSGERITAGAGDSAWVVNQAGEVFHWENGGFRRMPGTAVDIAANANGDVWMLGTPRGGNQRQRQRR